MTVQAIKPNLGVTSIYKGVTKDGILVDIDGDTPPTIFNVVNGEDNVVHLGNNVIV